jgi:hypothetical protein
LLEIFKCGSTPFRKNCNPGCAFSLFQNSIRRAAPKKVPIAVFGHPFGACQVALPSSSRPIGLDGRIDMQHNSRHLSPIHALGLRIEEAKVSAEEMVIVISDNISVRSLIGNRWIGRWLGHDHSASTFFGAPRLSANARRDSSLLGHKDPSGTISEEVIHRP